MTAIWNDIQITWKGQDYTITPNMLFLNYLERDEGLSLSKSIVRASRGDLPSSTASLIIAKTLTFAGCPVTDEQVFVETGGAFNSEATGLASAILMGCMPPAKESKKKTAKKTTGKS